MAANAVGARRKPPPAPVVQQPPAHLAHLTGDDLRNALETVRLEQWDRPRLAAESGRSPRTVDRWWHDYQAAEAGTAPRHHRTLIAPDGYIGGEPWWWDDRARKWMIGVGLMDGQTGVWLPPEATGRRRGPDRKPRKRPGPTLAQVGPALLSRYETLIGRGMSPAAARDELAVEHQLSARQVLRRLNAARNLAAGHRPEALDNAELLSRLTDMIDVGVDEDTARTRLAEQVGITRRQLATRITAGRTRTTGAAA